MGRKDKRYSKTLEQQIIEKLVSMQRFGESKHEAKLNNDADGKIFSIRTYKDYKTHCCYFAKWVGENYPNVTTMKKAKELAPIWLDELRSSGKYSVYTMNLKAAAVAKLFGYHIGDSEFYVADKRRRCDITRSRGEAASDIHFSESNNWELVCFCKGTGLRRSELEKLKGGDLFSKEQIEQLYMELFDDGIAVSEDGNLQFLTDNELSEYSVALEQSGLPLKRKMIMESCSDALKYFPDTEYFISVVGKGGRHRFSPITTKYEKQIVERIKGAKRHEKVWQKVHSTMDIHSYRAEYATAIYRKYARRIEDIPYDKKNKGTGRKMQSDVYTCRLDESGRKLDRKAMKICSKALGHNRIDVVATHYLRGL